MRERPDFPAFCPRWHRVIPSTGECYSMRFAPMLDGTYYEYVTGDCETVAAACEETA